MTMRALLLSLALTHASGFLSKTPALPAAGPPRGRSPRGAAPPRMFFERLSDDAVAAVMQAQQEAARMGCSEVGTEHLLLGLVQYPETADKALKSFGVGRVEDVRREAVALPGNGGGDEKKKGGLGDLFGSGGSAGGSGKGETLPFTGTAKKAFDASMKEAEGLKRSGIGSELLLVGCVTGASESSAVTVLENLKVDVEGLTEALREAARSAPELVGAGKSASGPSGEVSSTLDDFCTNLSEAAAKGELDAVIGREEEMRRLCAVLVRRRKNNACLIGDPGVGKTAIVEGLAQRIHDGAVPPRLRNATVLSLDLSAMVAGTRYRGAFEERLQTLLDEVKGSKGTDAPILLFVDELHNLLGAGSAGEGSMDAANMLKPALARGELQCVGATTVEEYRRYIGKDAALERRFQPIDVPEPDEEACLQILQGLKGSYEAHHGMSFADTALSSAVRLSKRYIPDRYLPDKAIDLLDEAGAEVQMDGGGGTVAAEDVASVVSRWTGVPITKLSLDEGQSLLDLERTIAQRVLGQSDAVNAVSRAVRRARAGLRRGDRPVASFLFCGPTGVGKTELAKALAGAYYGAEKQMVRLDMSEYMERHTVSRLTGPPPGYVGFEQGGQLTEAVRRNPHSLILLDEVEKAHPDVFNILLQVLDDGRLTDSQGRTVDFSNALLIMTANVGSAKILEELKHEADEGAADGAAPAPAPFPTPAPLPEDPASDLVRAFDQLRSASERLARDSGAPMDDDMKQLLDSLSTQGEQLRSALASSPPQGATPTPQPSVPAGRPAPPPRASAAYERVVGLVKGELVGQFRPEFLNRLDEVVVFRPLRSVELQSVARLLVASVAEAASAELGSRLDVSDAFLDRVVSDGTADPRYGARPMRRAVARLLEDPLAEAIMGGFIKAGDDAHVDVQQDSNGNVVTVMNMRNRAKRSFAVAGNSGGIEDAKAPAVDAEAPEESGEAPESGEEMAAAMPVSGA